MDRENILSVREVSLRLGVPEYRVRYWLRRGLLPHRLVGRTYVILRADLDRFRLPAHVPGTAGRPHAPVGAV